MKILSWNVQRIGAAAKRVLVKRLVHLQKTDIIFLQGTKCQDPDDGVIRSMCGSGSMDGWPKTLKEHWVVCGVCGAWINGD